MEILSEDVKCENLETKKAWLYQRPPKYKTKKGKRKKNGNSRKERRL